MKNVGHCIIQFQVKTRRTIWYILQFTTILLESHLDTLFCIAQTAHSSANHLRRSTTQSKLIETNRAANFRFDSPNAKRYYRHLIESTYHDSDYLINKKHLSETRKLPYDHISIDPRIINGEVARSERFPFYSFPAGNWLCG
jgi:hypothetical protein